MCSLLTSASLAARLVVSLTSQNQINVKSTSFDFTSFQVAKIRGEGKKLEANMKSQNQNKKTVKILVIPAVIK